MVWAAGAAFLAIAALVGLQDSAELTPGLMTAIATASTAGAAFVVLGRFQAKFQFVDWDNRFK